MADFEHDDGDMSTVLVDGFVSDDSADMDSVVTVPIVPGNILDQVDQEDPDNSDSDSVELLADFPAHIGPNLREYLRAHLVPTWYNPQQDWEPNMFPWLTPWLVDVVTAVCVPNLNHTQRVNVLQALWFTNAVTDAQMAVLVQALTIHASLDEEVVHDGGDSDSEWDPETDE
jgi:hypothetical protein